jgi:hypothetical protein
MHLSGLYFALGENDRGFEFYDQAYEQKDMNLIALKVGPDIYGIRSDPRYQTMLKKIGLDK